MNHFLVTRYNLGLYDRHPDPAAWMQRRAQLFARYTVPSVVSQRGAADFRWLLFVDERTPAEQRAAIPDGPWAPVPCATRWTDGLPDAAPFLRRRLCADLAPGDLVVTQRLDNDDAIAPDLVAAFQREVERAAELPCVLDPVHGSIVAWKAGVARVRRKTRPMNAFIAFAERMPEAGEPLTVWGDAHPRMADHGRRIVVETDEPAWRQTWHEENLWNGRRPSAPA